MDAESAKDHGLAGGMDAVVDIATLAEADTVVVAVAGVIGLIPTLAAIKARKAIALASKEVLVAAGELVMPLIRQHGVQLTPIDSEHSALFQCLQGVPDGALDSVILTASGGPFRGKSRDELAQMTVQQALNHPTWKMGGKITIDSATLMNKALEMIEAQWLFDLKPEQIEVVVHPQSIIHSMVRLTDGSVLAQMGWPDMRLPIQYALMYPDRPASHLPRWNPTDSPELTFYAPDETAFPALGYARRAMQSGGTMPCALNGANEEAVKAYLSGMCSLTDVFDLVEYTLEHHGSHRVTLDNLLEADQASRRMVRDRLGIGGSATSGSPRSI
jgi:1-deoxy-D-xylulose-5-phosphate reductoisomerase